MINEQPSYAKALQEVTASSRPKPYQQIHKGLRGLMTETLARVGRMDAHDRAGLAETLAFVDALLDACLAHRHYENGFFHKALREKAPRTVAVFDIDHESYEQAIGTLRQLTHRLRVEPEGVERRGYELYLELANFLAETLEHMAEEETVLTALLWQHFSDEEILDLNRRLVESIPLRDRPFWVGWIVAYIGHRERVELLQALRASVSPAVFAVHLHHVRSHMAGSEWDALARALGGGQREERSGTAACAAR